MSSRPPPEPLVLYLDRNLGGRSVAGVLGEAGIPFESHAAHLPHNAPDEEWIALCARNGWLGVTLDKHIRYRAPEIGAARAHGACVVVIRAKSASGAMNGEIFRRAYPRLGRFIAAPPPPVFAGVDRAGNIRPYSLD